MSERTWQIAAGSAIRSCREESGVSARKAAKSFNLSYGYYCKIDRGEVKADAETIEAIFDRFGIPKLDWMPPMGLIDKDTQRLFHTAYKIDPKALRAELEHIRDREAEARVIGFVRGD